jgi:hypothetical protein
MARKETQGKVQTKNKTKWLCEIHANQHLKKWRGMLILAASENR